MDNVDSPCRLSEGSVMDAMLNMPDERIYAIRARAAESEIAELRRKNKVIRRVLDDLHHYALERVDGYTKTNLHQLVRAAIVKDVG
jgi:hypothetical protein